MTRARWGLVALFFIVLLRTAWLGDDALISLRTILNATHGYGLTYNLAERVQTFTHPLWLAMIGAAYLCIGNIFYAAFVVSIAASLVLFVLVLRAARSMPQVWLVGGVLIASRAFVDYSTSGLENPLTALLAIGTLAWTARETRGRRWLSIVWLGVGLAYLARPDAVLLVLPAALWAAFQIKPRKAALPAVALGLLPALAWTIFALVYFGFAFPNTAYAKLAADIPWGERVHQGLVYLLDSVNRDPVTLTAIGVSLVVVAIERTRAARLALAGVVISLVYVVWIGGDFMSGRFLSAPLLVAVWLMARAERLTAADWRPALIVLAAAGIASPHLPLFSNNTFSVTDSYSGIVDERGVYFPTWGLVAAERNRFAEPEWPRADGRTTPEHVLDTCGLMGADGLEWGPRTYMLDECALADPLLARLPAVWKEDWRPGHFRRMIPAGYRESVEQDGNRLQDPALAGYYTALRTVVRGRPLWSAERLALIWRMNVPGRDWGVDLRFYKFGGEVASLRNLSVVVPDGTPWDAPESHPFVTELAVSCPDQTGRRVLDVSLDSDDRYRLAFLKTGRIVATVDVDPIPRDRREPGLASHLVDIPTRARQQGFDTVVIVSIAGDDRKAVGHLLLDGDPATAAELGRRFGAGK